MVSCRCQGNVFGRENNADFNADYVIRNYMISAGPLGKVMTMSYCFKQNKYLLMFCCNDR